MDEANRKLKAIQAEQSAVNLQIKQTEEEIKSGSLPETAPGNSK
ncbi:MAG: hypothetical protein ACLUIQ_09435 [Dialister invisus]